MSAYIDFFVVFFSCYWQASSGIDVSDELLSLYNEIKLKSSYKYLIFSLKQTGKEGKKITYGWSIDEKASPGGSNQERFSEVLSKLPEDSPCFVCFDFEDEKDDGRAIKKLLLIKWCPDNVHFRVKPVIGSTYQTLKEKLTGLGADIQAVDKSDLDYSSIKKML